MRFPMSLATSVSDPAFVSLVSAIPCRAEHAALLLKKHADVIARFISYSSCLPVVAAVLEPKLPFMFWNVMEIGSHFYLIPCISVRRCDGITHWRL